MVKILRLKQVMEITGKKRSSLYAAIKAGEFPAPIKLGAREAGWVSSEIETWINAKIAASRN